jgi:glutamate-ammonia-ligase adenylyltransferase
MDESTTGDDLLAALGRPYRPLLERFGSRHAELLRGVAAASPVRLVAEPCGDGRWTVSIAALDAVGVLVVIAGVFAGRRIDIRNGDVFSLRPKPAAPSASSRPGPRSPRRQAQPPRGNRGGRILDIFEVETSAHVDAAFWKDVEQELAALVSLLAQGEATAAIERVALGVSESVAGLTQGEDPLLPISVTLENHDDATATELRLHASDTPAFLFEFASALTLLDVDIERVRIRTLYGDAQNTFWVTDANGSKIEDPSRIQELRVATALIKQFSHLLPRSANPAQALQQFTKLASDTLRRPDWTATLESLGSGDVLRTLADMMGVSSFLWEDFLRLQHENLFPILSDIPGLEIAKDRAQLGREFASELEGSDGDEAKRALNGCKDREMFRIDLRHVTRRIDLEDFSAELTDLAEATVAAAADLCWRALRARHGTPTWPWCVCGAGKLGGRELGYASDIELVFVCDPDAESDADSKIVFAAFAQQFLKTLEARQNGVFEIDLRLRPFGESGPLTSTLETFRSYYRAEGQAHQFERLSLVKLRPIAGDRDLGKRIEAVRDGPAGAPGPGARPAGDDQRQVQPGRPGRRRVLHPVAPDRAGSLPPRAADDQHPRRRGAPRESRRARGASRRADHGVVSLPPAADRRAARGTRQGEGRHGSGGLDPRVRLPDPSTRIRIARGARSRRRAVDGGRPRPLVLTRAPRASTAPCQRGFAALARSPRS